MQKKPALLKQITAFLFIAAFAAQTFNKAFVVVDYFANTRAYAKNCENKARPQLHCNGKCQMMKKLKQEEKKDEQNPERKVETKNEYVLSSKSFYPGFTYFTSSQKDIFPLLISSKEIKMPRSLFHPPNC